jgi:hypothetical protein
MVKKVKLIYPSGGQLSYDCTQLICCTNERFIFYCFVLDQIWFTEIIMNSYLV